MGSLMIRITVELVPKGDNSKARKLWQALIGNDATGTMTRGNYRYTLSRRGAAGSVWKAGRIYDFPRKDLGVWDLMYRVLKDAVGNRNNT
jgi:hypothetical protein